MNLRLRHYLLAILLHGILFAFVFVGVQCSHPLQPPMAIQGTIVNPSEIKQKKQDVRQAQDEARKTAIAEAKRQAEKARQAELQQKQQEQLKAQQAAEQKKQQEAQKAAEQAKKQAAALAQQQAELKKQVEVQKKAEAEKQAKIKEQEKAAAEKAAAEKAAVEKAKQEAAKKAADEARQKAKAAKEKAEREAKAKAAAAKKKAEMEKQRAAELQRQLGAEAQQLKASSQNAWIGAITSRLASNWLRPAGVPDTIVCTVKVQLANNGHVLSVEVVSGSGNSLFDDSVRRAVLKSDPLPLPADPTAFDSVLKLHFTPQELQNAG